LGRTRWILRYLAQATGCKKIDEVRAWPISAVGLSIACCQSEKITDHRDWLEPTQADSTAIKPTGPKVHHLVLLVAEIDPAKRLVTQPGSLGQDVASTAWEPFMRIIMLCLLLAAALASCTYRENDVSNHPQARELIGTKYKVVQDIRAYGVRPHSGAEAQYIIITAPPGFSGPEVAFEDTVHAGAELTVLKVLKTNRLLDDPYTVIVRLDRTDLHSALPIQLELFNTNVGASALSLNPAFYQRIEPTTPTHASKQK
jgi:hypothetical protein